LVAGVEYRALERAVLPEEREDAYCPRPVARIAARFISLENDAAIEQEYLQVLRAFREELQLDRRVGPGDAFQHRPGEVRMETLELAHRLERDRAQLGDTLWMFLGLIEGEVGAQLRFDLIVAG